MGKMPPIRHYRKPMPSKRGKEGAGEAWLVVNRNAVDRWFVDKILPQEGELTQYLRRRWRNQAEIPDLRQEIYVRIYEAATQCIPDAARPFMFTTARNLLIDRARRAQIVSIETVMDIDGLNIAHDQPDPERNAMGREMLRLMQTAINHLPPRCREVVMLRKVHGLAQRDVARRMGISEGTVENQVAKGIRLIVDMMTDCAGAGRPPGTTPGRIRRPDRSAGRP